MSSDLPGINKPSDEIQIATPYGNITSRTRDIMQMLPLLAMIAMGAAAGWLLYKLAEEYIAIQRASMQEILEAAKGERKAITEAMRTMSAGIQAVADEQAITNYINSLPMDRRPKLMVPRALQQRLAPGGPQLPTPPDQQ